MRKAFKTTRRPRMPISDREFARRVERLNAAERAAKRQKPRPRFAGPRGYRSPLSGFDGIHTGIGAARRGLTS